MKYRRVYLELSTLMHIRKKEKLTCIRKRTWQRSPKPAHPLYKRPYNETRNRRPGQAGSYRGAIETRPTDTPFISEGGGKRAAIQRTSTRIISVSFVKVRK